MEIEGEYPDPDRAARTPAACRRYLASAMAEFTAVKGVDVRRRNGWLSDRAARYLSKETGMFFVENAAGAAEAVGEIMRDWERCSREARGCAVEVFDSARNLRRILDI